MKSYGKFGSRSNGAVRPEQATAEHFIQEPVGHTWIDELVCLPLDRTEPVRVINARTGESLPSQVSGAQVFARVSLSPGERLDLRVESTKAPSTPNPFAIDSNETTLTVSNGRIAVRVPKDRAFEPGEAPGPVLALKRNDRWIGRGVWGTDTDSGCLETTLIDRGPLFARWVTRYIVGSEEAARYECRMDQGEDFVRISDQTRPGTGGAFRFRLADRDVPREWFTYGGGEFVKVARGRMDQPPDPRGPTRENEFIHLDFHSGHFQMSYTWVGFILPPDTAIGVAELRGGHWNLPGRNRIRVLRAGDGVEFVFPADGGSKEVALVCGDAAAYAPETELSRFCHLRRKYSDIPLEKVRHWVTDWQPSPCRRPTLYPRGTLEGWRRKLDAWPRLDQAYRERDLKFASAELVRHLVQGGAAQREKLIQQVDGFLQTAVDHVLANGYLRLIIFDGRALKVALEIIDVLRWRGELDESSARSFRRRAAFLAYCFSDRDFWPWESAFRDRRDPRSLGEDYWDDIGGFVCPPNFFTEYYTSFGLVALTYPDHPRSREWIAQAVELFERNLAFCFYESGAYAESVNYHAHELGMLVHLAVGLLAAGERDFFEHPRFKASFGFFLDMLTPPAALTEAGREVASAENMLNPPGDGRGVMLTNWGNSGHDCSGYVVPVSLAVAAGIYAERDSGYARRLMTAWRSSAQEFCNAGLALHLVVLGRPDLPDLDLKLQSALVEGLGAVMRADTTFAWIKCGTATHHNCRDEGGLVLYAHGAPLIGDFGYTTRHENRTEGAVETWKHACVTFGGKRTLAYLGTETATPPELWRSTSEADLLVAYLPIERLIPEGDGYLHVERVPRIEHRRFVLFVKPHYFVIYDHISRTPLPSSWWMHALADSVEISPQHARFRGRFGVDLSIQVLLPSPARISEGTYSVQRHIRIDQPGAGDYLTVLTALPRGAREPGIHWLADDRCIQVEGPWGVDEVFVSTEKRTIRRRDRLCSGRVVLFRNGTAFPIDGEIQGEKD